MSRIGIDGNPSSVCVFKSFTVLADVAQTRDKTHSWEVVIEESRFFLCFREVIRIRLESFVTIIHIINYLAPMNRTGKKIAFWRE